MNINDYINFQLTQIEMLNCFNMVNFLLKRKCDVSSLGWMNILFSLVFEVVLLTIVVTITNSKQRDKFLLGFIPRLVYWII